MKLIDFGFAKFWDRSRNMTQASVLTEEGEESGRLRVGPLECASEPVMCSFDTPTDVCLLYNCLV